MAQSEIAAGEAAESVADRFVIDGRASRFTVRAFATGILAAMGHNPIIGIRDFSGEMSFHPGQLQAGSFRLVIQSKSLNVEDDISDKDRREIERLMHQEVLETARFREILFEATNVQVTKLGEALFSASISGDLTLKGVTRSERIQSRVTLMSSILRASGEFSLNQTDFGIQLVSVAGGALKLKDELKFQFEIVARKQE